MVADDGAVDASSSVDSTTDEDIASARADTIDVTASDDVDVMRVIDRPNPTFDAEDEDVGPVDDVPNYDARVRIGQCDAAANDAAIASTARSCGGPGAPAQHCNRVHFCGGTFHMGSTDAWTATNVWSNPPFYAPQRECDLHEATVFDGWVDAYEVSVARYRAYLQAGHPQPADGEWINRDFRWQAIEDSKFGVQVPDAGGPFGVEACTFSPRWGTHDDLPMNCLRPAAMIAFCWWEGGHLITEEAWEFLATNRGTTITPIGPIPLDAELCGMADVGTNEPIDLRNPMGPTVCPRRTLPLSVFARPTDQTRNPIGIFGMLGGVGEAVFSASTRPACEDALCRRGGQAPNVSEGGYSSNTVKGSTWIEQRGDMRRTLDARGGKSTEQVYSFSLGFRCAGWD